MSGQREGRATYLGASDVTSTNDLVPPRRVLAVGAHPDDIEFGMGATLAKWHRLGTELVLVVLTDGRRGTWDRDMDLLELAVTRRHEGAEAAQCLGAAPPIALAVPDGELAVNDATVARLVVLLRRVQPTLVATHDPWTRDRLHPDHQAAGSLVTRAIVAARDHGYWPELGYEPTRPETLLLFETDRVNHLEHVERDDLRTKAQALACHRSQYPSSFGLALDSPDAEAAIEGMLESAHVSRFGHALIEGFHRIDDL